MATPRQGHIERRLATLGARMGRREFIALVGAVALARPVTARAQQKPVIGFLSSASPHPYSHFVKAFQRGLADAGYVDGQNVTIEYRWAEGRYDRLPALVSDLVGRQVAVIAATGGPPAMAAKVVTTIPVVFAVGYDPVAVGLVASLNRPGGNITGVTFFGVALLAKRLELLLELVPTAKVVALLLNPNNANAGALSQEGREAAGSVGRQVEVVNASSDAEVDAAFASIAGSPAGALLVAADPFFNERRDVLVARAAHYGIPANYELREFVDVGGLMSYGVSLGDSYRQAGIYVGRILKGEKPADLPVQQPTKFELVINLKTAKALGLPVPPTLLARADEVIE
jgi:putative ABC transport system substrate-binding protein